MGYNETTWKFPVSWGLRARVVTRPTIRQQKHRTCETGFTHTVHLNIVILNMSEYGEGGSGQILFVLRRNFPNPPIRPCNILISPHPLIGSQVSLAPLLPPLPPPPLCTDPSPLQLKTMSGERTKNLEDWTKTVIKSLTKYDGANCYNNFLKTIFI